MKFFCIKNDSRGCQVKIKKKFFFKIPTAFKFMERKSKKIEIYFKKCL